MPKKGRLHRIRCFKRITGTKIHVAVESNGLPVSIVMSPANEHDSTRFIGVMESISDHLDDDMVKEIVAVYADKGYCGKFVIDGLATELVGQNNQSTSYSHGVDILVRKGCMERVMAQARGNLVTFGAGFNSGIYMSDGILINLGPPGEQFGSGMVGGVIYTRQGTTTGKGVVIKKLDDNDYEKIKRYSENYCLVFQVLAHKLKIF